MMQARLLVTTYRKAFVHGRGGTVLDEGRGPYFGVTWSPDMVFVAARNWKKDGKDTLVLTYDGELRLVAEARLPEVREIHQMLWWGGLVYICDTGHDRVLAWDGEGARAVYEATRAMEDRSHVNSVWCDGERFWVTELYARRVRAFDLGWNLLETVPLEHEAHNVYVEGGRVYVCASDQGRLARVGDRRDSVDLSASVASGEYSYARGLARTGSRFYVGLSLARRREDRGDGGCRVAVLDGGLARVGEIRFEGTGDIHSLRAMDGTDRAHNRVRCPA